MKAILPKVSMSPRWSRSGLFSEWWREPLSPVAETWQTVLLETAALDVFGTKMGVRPSKFTKVFNGYLYITSSYGRILFPFGFAKLFFGILKGIRTAKTEWQEKALLHSKQIDEFKKIPIENLSLRGLFELCDTVLRKEAEYIAWSLYVGIYSFGFEYALSWGLPVFVKGYGKFDYRDLLKGFCDKSIEASLELRKTSDIASWLETYGHRVQDLDVIYPTLQDAPELAASLKQQLLQSPQNPEENLAEERKNRQQLEEEILHNIRRWIPFGRTLFLELLKMAQAYVSLRNDRPFYYKGQALARIILLEIGARLKLEKKLESETDVFFLTYDEIRYVSEGKNDFKKATMTERKDLRERRRQQLPPANLKEPFPGEFPMKRLAGNGRGAISGIAASKGKTTGRARVILSQGDFHKFQAEDILVMESTNPSFVPLMVLARGIITDKGGALCHAAIVSRELGIPAVVGTETATSVIKDGDFVLVDGDVGSVQIVDQNYDLNFRSNNIKKEEWHSNTTNGNTDLQPEQTGERKDLITTIASVTNKDIYLVGGKGASLGELVSLGLNVPPGFILTTEMYGKNIADYEKEILREFDRFGIEYAAVRSSANAEDSPKDSFAGQFETYLNVNRNTLLAAIEKCWDSINQPGIIEYCRARNIDRSKVRIAVVVQKMIQPDASGICFTVDPITAGQDEIVIEAVYGLGEFIVSGQVTPDSYVVDKKSSVILNKRIAVQDVQLVMVDGTNREILVPGDMRVQQKLSDDKVIELANFAAQAEAHYRTPLDMEWACQNNILYFTQARPVTTLQGT